MVQNYPRHLSVVSAQMKAALMLRVRSKVENLLTGEIMEEHERVNEEGTVVMNGFLEHHYNCSCFWEGISDLAP